MLSLFLSAAPAQAASVRLCSGYAGCQNAGYSHAGYAGASAANTMYWRMLGGHNCTNYVAYRLIHSNGMANQRPWSGDGNANNWGRLNSSKVDQNPTVSSVAWWDANASGAGPTGHVAYVEQVISANEIIISEDNWVGDFHWKRVTRGGPGWPSGFIHFQDIPQGSAKPFGSFDSAEPVLGGVLLRGWAIDPDTNDSIDVHVYSNGVYRGAVRADKHRPDVDAVHGRGAYHGYEYFLGTEFAVGSVKVYAINAGGGDNPELGVKQIAASSTPFGHLDEVVGMDGNVRLRGWALDPDTNDPIDVHIYRDGVGLASVKAFLTRDDVDKAHGRGAKHGFEVLLPAGSGGGTYTIYAINYGSGGNPVIATAAGPPVVTSSPTVSGSAVFGQTLTANPGSWSTGGLNFSYQ
ncbi:CHAP domain-containing protein [Pseudoclavibacter sp. RFBB5]|uniref:CHAP domain-containing protein n=1 Tax=Pseudoclavibacter sp. RFBB5 TaxID=2080574 RepID=UPI000CE92538|nr:CHAP domain-containing protein [Pseudoclavibacter sp. RFBB5]PPG33474.1 hypothetical protein C5B97_02395 [Pseudoclavibacter sp. RFBB5]